jgi:hypothetical protein
MNSKLAVGKVSRPGIPGGLIVLGITLALALFIHTPADAAAPEEIVASTGCAMAHCDQALSDNANFLPTLSGQVVEALSDRDVSGSGLGIGCSSNGDIAVCSFRSSSSKPVEIRAYNVDEQQTLQTLWSSTALSSYAWASPPIVASDGGVIAVDQSRIIRFGPQGVEKWRGATAGGLPIGSNVTDNGEIILATRSGPVSAYDSETGRMLAQLRLNDTVQYNNRQYSGYFDTVNVPAVKGSRVYIATQFKYDSFNSQLPVGRLYALDLVCDQNDEKTCIFQIAWNFEFKAPSGSSPTVRNDEGKTVIYFDGNGLTPSGASRPLALAVEDLGTSGTLLWSSPLAVGPQASPALDPRDEGGIWFYPFHRSELLRLDESDGHVLQTINIDTLITDAGTWIPVSVMTISGNPEAPVMMFAASTSNYSRTYAVAIDLNSGALLWKFPIDEGKGLSGVPFGQFPVLSNSNGEPVVVFSTYQNGVWALKGSQPTAAGN